MTKGIAVLDLVSGEVFDREKQTLTLDLPSDLAPSAPDLVLDANRLGRYETAGGAIRVYSAKPMFLWRRTAGEECLVARLEVDSGTPICTRRYARSIVKP